MKNDIEVIKEFEKDTGIVLVSKVNNGFVFSGDYVIWLEDKVKKLYRQRNFWANPTNIVIILGVEGILLAGIFTCMLLIK